MDALRLTASQRSVGKTMAFKGKNITIEATTPELLAECDIAFVSANDDVSKEIGELGPKQGCVVIDDSGVWRMDPSVPLVVPEINGDDVDSHKGLLAIPNCSTTPLAMALAALSKGGNRPKRVIASTYQSVSGTGAAAMQELNSQAGQVLKGEPTKAEQYPHQIAFNVLPHIGSLKDDGYYSEEVKMRQETQKILHREIAIATTCVRVPVPICHSEAVNVEFERPMSPDEARSLLAAFPGVVVVDDPANAKYPMPIDATGRDETFVGRIRPDTSTPNGIAMWIVSDNLRKGAATNAIQIAEEVVKRGAWLRERV